MKSFTSSEPLYMKVLTKAQLRDEVERLQSQLDDYADSELVTKTELQKELQKLTAPKNYDELIAWLEASLIRHPEDWARDNICGYRLEHKGGISLWMQSGICMFGIEEPRRLSISGFYRKRRIFKLADTIWRRNTTDTRLESILELCS